MQSNLPNALHVLAESVCKAEYHLAIYSELQAHANDLKQPEALREAEFQLRCYHKCYERTCIMMEMLELLGHGEAAGAVRNHIRYGISVLHDRWRKEYRERFNPKHYDGEEKEDVGEETTD